MFYSYNYNLKINSFLRDNSRSNGNSYGMLTTFYCMWFSENASRWCWSNGTWDNYSNYSMCRDVRLPTIEPGIEITTTLYFIGYSLSLFTLIMAVCIFIYYKWVKNTHLKFFLFMLHYFFWKESRCVPSQNFGKIIRPVRLYKGAKLNYSTLIAKSHIYTSQ